VVPVLVVKEYHEKLAKGPDSTAQNTEQVDDCGPASEEVDDAEMDRKLTIFLILRW
jgi:hypothetical protein